MSHKIAIMQPYLFPYLGYFQLINAVDKFVVYDDVSFIKGGWINRNRINMNGKPLMFSVPISGVSSNVPINMTKIDQLMYDKWLFKFLKTIKQCYGNRRYYNEVLDLIKCVFNDTHIYISDLAVKSIKETCKYICINTEIVASSCIYNNSHLRSADRVVDICHQEGADVYLNPIGGMELYSKSEFNDNGLELGFLKAEYFRYDQGSCDFMPFLSIVDVMMCNDRDVIIENLGLYNIV